MILRRWQTEALGAVRQAWRTGTSRALVQACTGAGKSVLIGEVARLGRGRVLVTTPTQLLVEQLASSLEARLGEGVGRAYQHAWDLDPRVVVTCLPTLPAVLAVRPEWGCWIADEAHRIEGDACRQIRAELRSTVALGVTATAYRGDDRGLVWDRLVYAYTSYQAVDEGVLVPWRIVRATDRRPIDEVCAEWVASAEGPGVISARTVADAEDYAAQLGPAYRAIHGGQSRAVQQALIERLRVGELRALVHCQLLAEGVDLPWLRWICLRRRVSSPVRLVQEIGRVLRAAPGKTEAVIYDPHDACGAVGLVHGARLEDVGSPTAPEAEAELDQLDLPELLELEPVRGVERAVAVDRLAAWLIDVVAWLRGHGLAEAPPPTATPTGPWRRGPATERQRLAAQRLAWAARYLAPWAAAAIEALLVEPRLRSGVASDCLTVLVAAGRRRQRLELPALTAPATVEDPHVRVRRTLDELRAVSLSRVRP